jgi:ethanolamine ammonia-lyase small subunit
VSAPGAPPPFRDPFARLRAMTPARVGLGRSGDGLPTAPMLAFQLAHAAARDAVHAALDSDRLAAALAPRASIRVASQAVDRTTYLQRPDLGRRLAAEDAARLTPGDWDLAIVAADGLSATAVHAHAPPLIAALAERLPGWRLAPVTIATQARVALGDEIGAALGARLALVLIGERPGLSAPDSLGAYLTWGPAVGTPDSARNCVSNIRPPHGLDYGRAADTLAWLMTEARARGLTGVALKDERPAASGAAILSAAPERE